MVKNDEIGGPKSKVQSPKIENKIRKKVKKTFGKVVIRHGASEGEKLPFRDIVRWHTYFIS